MKKIIWGINYSSYKVSEEIEPVVAKGLSVVQAFRKTKRVLWKSCRKHGTSGFEQFGEMLGRLQGGYTYYMVNRLQPERAKGTQ